jgi:twinkle protein
MRTFFPDLRRETGAIGYPYTKNANVLGYKVRSLEEKAFVCTKALKTPFGLDQVDLDDSKTLIFVEGELDVFSCYEAGVNNAISVPNGAQSLGSEEKGFLWECKEILDKAEKVIIAVDNDEPGEKLADELSRRIGKHRCWKIEWPEACKDANDVLMKYSATKLQEVMDRAEPWPIAGLYEADRFFPELDNLYENGFSARIRTGLENIDHLYSVGSGLLTVVTGVPSMGKSTFVDQLMCNLARMYGYKFAICSFENPPAIHQGKLAEMLTSKNFWDRDIGGRMSKGEMEAAKRFIFKHFTWIYQDDGGKSDVDSIIERIKMAVFRHGVQGVVIDPMNYVQKPKNMESETSWVDDTLTKLRLTASLLSVHIWVVAHPTKMPQDAEGRYQPPLGYSISGSSAYFSKPDFGLTVHRENGEVRIINWKARYNFLGQMGEAKILYDSTHNSYIVDMEQALLPLSEDYK